MSAHISVACKQLLYKNNTLAGMGAVAYVTLAKSYGTGGIDRQAWMAVVFMQQARSGNWGQMSERRAGLFAPNCKTFLSDSNNRTLVGGHVDQWTMHFKLLPKRRGRRGAAPLYIILFLFIELRINGPHGPHARKPAPVLAPTWTACRSTHGPRMVHTPRH